MGKHNKVLLGMSLAGLLASSTALAAGPFSNWLTVSNIEVAPTATGTTTYLAFSSAPSGRPTACNTDPSVILFGNAEHVKAMTSVALSAFLAGKSIRIYYEGTCEGPYPRVRLLQMQ
ncbi:MAG TPA: hypothetical protein VJV79_27295 [Polyangiaceae bacterium]|nr:hypothetical protein [Polyangiaceae bacterium]